MKRKLIIFCLLATSFSCAKKSTPVQEPISQSITTTRTSRTTRYSLDGKLFNADTGEAISMEEFSKMVEVNNRIPLEKIYNKYGEPEKFLYHPNSTEDYGKRDPEKSPKKGDVFPDFIMTNIEGEEVALEDLKGQWVLLRFDFFVDMLDKNDYGLFADMVNELPRNSNVVPIVCSLDPKDQVEEKLVDFSKRIHLVSDGSGFSDMYHITRFPTTFLIAPDQTVYDFFGRSNYSEIPGIIK